MPKLVTVDEILSSPDDWHCRETRVLGVFTYDIENISIALRKDDPQRLWVDCTSPIPEVTGVEFRYGECREVVIEGVVEIGGCGHFGMFPGQLTHVRRLVASEQWVDEENSQTPG